MLKLRENKQGGNTQFQLLSYLVNSKKRKLCINTGKRGKKSVLNKRKENNLRAAASGEEIGLLSSSSSLHISFEILLQETELRWEFLINGISLSASAALMHLQTSRDTKVLTSLFFRLLLVSLLF